MRYPILFCRLQRWTNGGRNTTMTGRCTCSACYPPYRTSRNRWTKLLKLEHFHLYSR